MKRAIAALTCATALATSLTACGGEAKSSLPLYTPGSSPSSTATSTPTTPPTTAGPVALAAHTTYTYGGLKVIVNLPAEIPNISRPTLQLFTKFLQAVGRSKARNKLDPSLSGLASENVVKYVQTSIVPTSVQAIGTVSYTITNVHTDVSGYALVTGCLDQSKLVQTRKDGSHFVAQAKTHPTLKLKADINLADTGLEVTNYTFALGTC